MQNSYQLTVIRQQETIDLEGQPTTNNRVVFRSTVPREVDEAHVYRAFEALCDTYPAQPNKDPTVGYLVMLHKAVLEDDKKFPVFESVANRPSCVENLTGDIFTGEEYMHNNLSFILREGDEVQVHLGVKLRTKSHSQGSTLGFAGSTLKSLLSAIKQTIEEHETIEVKAARIRHT